MKSIFLDNDTMSILAAIRNRDQVDENAHNRQKQKLGDALAKAGALVSSGKETDALVMDDTAQMMIKTYLKSSTRSIVEFHKQDRIIMRGYYFSDDVIVMLDAYRDGGELLWLPSAKQLVGSVAEMTADQSIACENEEFEGSFSAYCTKTDYFDVLSESVSSEKYRQLLHEDISQLPQLWMKGTSPEDNNCFIYVVFKDNCAIYFKQEDNKLFYGTADHSTIVNILSHWMLYRHRDLIAPMLEEDNEHVL